MVQWLTVRRLPNRLVTNIPPNCVALPIVGLFSAKSMWRLSKRKF